MNLRSMLFHVSMSIIMTINIGCGDQPVGEAPLSATKYIAHIDFILGNSLNFSPSSGDLGDALREYQTNILQKIYGDSLYLEHLERDAYTNIYYISGGGEYCDYDTYENGVAFSGAAELLQLIKVNNYCSNAYNPPRSIPTVSVFITQFYNREDDPLNRTWRFPNVPDEYLAEDAEEMINFGIHLFTFDQLDNRYPSIIIFANTINCYFDETWTWSMKFDGYPIWELSPYKTANVILAHELCHALGLPEIKVYGKTCHDEDQLGNSCRCVMNYIPMKHLKTATLKSDATLIIENLQLVSICASCEADTHWVEFDTFYSGNFNTCSP